MSESKNCEVCKKTLEGEELFYAEEQGNHPGYLGLVDPKCYSDLVSAPEGAALPWTDPISGEVDYEEMASDLGVDDSSAPDQDEYWNQQDGYTY